MGHGGVLEHFELWNLVDSYNPDAVIATVSWLKEDISNAEKFLG
jgi:hypothetical protein